MSSRTKIVIVIALFILMFIAGQMGALKREPKSNSERRGENQESLEEQPNWVGFIESGLDKLGLMDDIDIRRLSILDSVALVSGKRCEADLDAGLLVMSSTCTVRIKVQSIDDKDPYRVRIVPDAGCKRVGADVPNWPTLNIAYQPSGRKKSLIKPPWDCGDNPVKLIIFQAGGVMELRCEQCTSARQLHLKLE